MLIKISIFSDSDGIEIRAPFYRYFNTFLNIVGGLYTQVFNSWGWRSGVRGDVN